MSERSGGNAVFSFVLHARDPGKSPLFFCLFICPRDQVVTLSSLSYYTQEIQAKVHFSSVFFICPRDQVVTLSSLSYYTQEIQAKVHFSSVFFICPRDQVVTLSSPSYTCKTSKQKFTFLMFRTCPRDPRVTLSSLLLLEIPAKLFSVLYTCKRSNGNVAFCLYTRARHPTITLSFCLYTCKRTRSCCCFFFFLHTRKRSRGNVFCVVHAQEIQG